jgi:hypothetical protein
MEQSMSELQEGLVQARLAMDAASSGRNSASASRDQQLLEDYETAQAEVVSLRARLGATAREIKVAEEELDRRQKAAKVAQHGQVCIQRSLRDICCASVLCASLFPREPQKEGKRKRQK